jgi:hypothetical protein
MLKITVDSQSTMAWLGGIQKQVAYATARALTATAREVQRRIPAALEKDLDRPNQFTKSGTFVIPARKDKLQATVAFKDKQAKYMRLQIEGGSRTPGARGLKLPGDVTLDQHGNIPRGTIAKMIQAAKAGKYGKAVRTRLGINASGKAPSNLALFYGKPKNFPDLPVGIWRTDGRTLTPVIVFPTNKPARYRPRFKFKELVERTVAEVWPHEFDKAFADAMRTAT